MKWSSNARLHFLWIYKTIIISQCSILCIFFHFSDKDITVFLTYLWKQLQASGWVFYIVVVSLETCCKLWCVNWRTSCCKTYKHICFNSFSPSLLIHSIDCKQFNPLDLSVLRIQCTLFGSQLAQTIEWKTRGRYTYSHWVSKLTVTGSSVTSALYCEMNHNMEYITKCYHSFNIISFICFSEKTWACYWNSLFVFWDRCASTTAVASCFYCTDLYHLFYCTYFLFLSCLIPFK